jgi:hypothetical protein
MASDATPRRTRSYEEHEENHLVLGCFDLRRCSNHRVSDVRRLRRPWQGEKKIFFVAFVFFVTFVVSNTRLRAEGG